MGVNQLHLSVRRVVQKSTLSAMSVIAVAGVASCSSGNDALPPLLSLTASVDAGSPTVAHDGGAGVGTPVVDAGGTGDDDDDDGGSLFGDDTGDVDGGPSSPGLAEVSSTYPAVTPDIAQLVVNDQAAILTAPRIVTVVWKSDPNLAQLEAFDGAIGSSTYWHTALSEYGVGAATNTNYEISSAPPTTLSEDDLDTLVFSDVSSGTWPAPTAQTIYIVYLPEATTFTTVDDSGHVVNACSTLAGYHSETNYDSESKPHYTYAVIPEQCGESDYSVPTTVDSLTATASHELAEASTDPLPDIDPGLLYFDQEHLSYEYFQEGQDENGDACEFYASSFYQEGADLPYYVQRLWSNASAAAGHNPCVPRVSGQPYYNVSLTSPEQVTIRFADGTSDTSEGYRIAPGTTKTIPFRFISDQPTDGGWFLSAAEGNGLGVVSPSRLSIHVDTPQGVNGQTGSVTVTVNSVGDSTAQLITLRSHAGTSPAQYMPILIGAY